MIDAPELLLANHLKTLRLPTFLREHDKQARICAAEGVDHVRYLARLTELELIDRERRMVERRIKSAKFSAVKSLDSFDFRAIASLNKMMVMDLARCDWIDRRENVIALGPSGTGKTHVALGLGLAACQKGTTVSFVTASSLVHELMETRDEKRLLRLQRQLAKVSLLIIDELSRDSRVAQRIGVSFSIQCCDGNVDVTIEMLWVSEGLMGEVVGLEIEPDAFDVIEFGGIFWQPFDRQPVSAFS